MKVELEGNTKEVEFEGKLIDLMAKLNITPQEYVCILNGDVVTEFEEVTQNDSVKFVRVWSGG